MVVVAVVTVDVDEVAVVREPVYVVVCVVAEIVTVVWVNVVVAHTGIVPLKAWSVPQEKVAGSPTKYSAQLTVHVPPTSRPLQLWLYDGPHTGTL